MLSDKFQEFHERIGVVLINLLSTYFQIIQKSVSRGSKSLFQCSKWNVQYLDKRMRKYCKGYDQSLHQHHHQHQFSNHIDRLLFVKLDSQSYNNHTYKTAVSYRVRKGSLHQNPPLKSLVYFLLQSFQKKTTLVQICWPSACAVQRMND